MPISDATVPESRSKNLLEKALSLFSSVNAGEGITVVVLFLNAFIMMELYYILKPVREGLILSGFGAAVKSYASAAQAGLFLLIIPIYGAFAARVNRVKLLSGMTIFFITNLILFILALGAEMQIGLIYFIWLGIFSFMIPSQFWAFATDIYSEDQGKRLLPVVGIGASGGALAGSYLTSSYFAKWSNSTLLTLACVLLFVFMALIIWVNSRETAHVAGIKPASDEPLSKEGGFTLVRKSRYLMYVAFFVLFLNMVNTVGEFLLGSLFQQEAISRIGAGPALQTLRGNFIRTQYGEFFGWVNLIGLLTQSFLVSRFINFLGVRGALFIGPFMSLLTYGTIAVMPILSVTKWMKIAENSNDYSTNNTVRQTLFLPMSRDVKYKAKAAIDTFFGRAGDALQAVVVFAGTQLALSTQGFAFVNAAFVGIWIAIGFGIVREHKKLAKEG